MFGRKKSAHGIVSTFFLSRKARSSIESIGQEGGNQSLMREGMIELTENWRMG